MGKVNIYNLIILDESGSMQSIKNYIMNGFNELVKSIQISAEKYPEQNHLISLVTFNSAAIKPVLDRRPLHELQPIDNKLFKPEGCTPLYDAIGESVFNLLEKLEKDVENRVLVSILSDGLENASVEFTGDQIKKLIEKLKDEKWTFVYMGTDHDVEQVSKRLALNFHYQFEKSESGILDMMTREEKARMRYYERVSKNEDLAGRYYEE